MREGWKEITVGDLGQIITGNTPPRKQPELYGKHTLFVKPTDMEVGRKYCYNAEEFYSEKGFTKYQKSVIPKDSTCVVTIGSIGQKMIKAHIDLFINQAVNAIVPTIDYDSDFVYYLLKINLFQLKTFDSGTASGRENVSKSSFSSIKLIVPESKTTQRKIASILSSYDDLIENNLKRIKLLEEKAQLTYEEWFVKMRFPGYETAKFDDVTGLPEGWEKKTIGDMIEVGRGSSPRPISNQKYFIDGNIPWLKIADATASHIYIYKTKEYVNDYGASFSRKLKPGSIIVAASGTLGFPMFLAVEACIHDGWLYFTGIAEELKEYFYFSFIGLRTYFEQISYGAAIQNINTGIVKQSPFILPNEVTIKNFKQFIEPYFNSIKNLQNQINLLKEARDILLPRLMSGMIDPDKLSGQVVDGITGQVEEEMEMINKKGS